MRIRLQVQQGDSDRSSQQRYFNSSSLQILSGCLILKKAIINGFGSIPASSNNLTAQDRQIPCEGGPSSFPNTRILLHHAQMTLIGYLPATGQIAVAGYEYAPSSHVLHICRIVYRSFPYFTSYISSSAHEMISSSSSPLLVRVKTSHPVSYVNLNCLISDCMVADWFASSVAAADVSSAPRAVL